MWNAQGIKSRLPTACFIMLIVAATPGWGAMNLAQCVVNFARMLQSPVSEKQLYPLSVAGTQNWVSESGRSLLNGSLAEVEDTDGKPRRIIVLSHYLYGHVTEKFPLPAGWKFRKFLHRGEYDFTDGKLTQVNETSGQAFETDAGKTNKVAAAKTALIGTRWVSANTQWISFNLGNEHFYPGFNRDPSGISGTQSQRRSQFLHSGRNKFSSKFSFLGLSLSQGKDVGSAQDCQEILAHWDQLTMGIPPTPETRLLKRILEIRISHPTHPVEPGHAEIGLRGYRYLKERQQALQIVEITD